MCLFPEELNSYEPKEEDLQRLRGLRPIDDDFMRAMFRENKPLAELVLRILMGKPDLTVDSLETQADMKQVAGARSICLDVLATSESKKFDIEVQRADKGAEPHRARYHASVLDVENLKPKQKYDELPIIYVIFITENDIFDKGAALYPIERINTTTGQPFGDDEHILYVNGQYRDDSEIGKLMHDFSCSDPDDMKIDLMRESASIYKKTESGVRFMCKAMEDMRNEEKQRTLLEAIRSLMKNLNLSFDDAAKGLGLSEKDRAIYKSML